VKLTHESEDTLDFNLNSGKLSGIHTPAEVLKSQKNFRSTVKYHKPNRFSKTSMKIDSIKDFGPDLYKSDSLVTE
jgi:hypothetical protein